LTRKFGKQTPEKQTKEMSGRYFVHGGLKDWLARPGSMVGPVAAGKHGRTVATSAS